MRACGVILTLLLAANVGSASAGELTARDYFRMLPGTIFENTTEGMPEDEKLQLLETGRSNFWEFQGEEPDRLELAAMPFGESRVVLRVFRSGEGGKGSTLLAIGAMGPACAIELWRADADGRIVPVDTPEDPPAKDFFAAKNGAPRGTNVAVLFCLDEEGLEARPVFWNDAGMLQMPVDFRVHYTWGAGGFAKSRTPVKP